MDILWAIVGIYRERRVSKSSFLLSSFGSELKEVIQLVNHLRHIILRADARE